LELATIAFTGLNFVIYLLWWDKPLNVQCGVRVYKKRTTEEPVDDGHVLATAGFWVALGDALSKLPVTIVHGPLAKDAPFDLDERPWPVRVLAWPVVKSFEIIVGGFGDVVGKRVGMFYPCTWKEYWTDTWPLVMVIAVIASAFGGIHCIAWSFTFPTITEKILWRVASISITSVPIALFLPVFLLDCDSLDDFRDLFKHLVPDQTLLYYGVPQIVLYILSRLVLLILPFLTLRSLPPTAYHTVDWTSFIPHI